ncbi:hypothetical protein ABVF61_16735 [Roseibium sp. HPY-6]|uniref:hypothetical protein n=1 Tax=Roseibium sp. HPY-6 TaxID=3229852 RepID=UPI00338E6A47
MTFGQAGWVKVLSAAIFLLFAALFTASSVTSSSLSLPSVSYGTVYAENIPQRVVPLVVQSVCVEAPADKTISNGLQKDDWPLEPTPEYQSPYTGRALGRLGPPKSEWIEAASAGVVATAVSLTVMFSAGVRINWA